MRRFNLGAAQLVFEVALLGGVDTSSVVNVIDMRTPGAAKGWTKVLHLRETEYANLQKWRAFFLDPINTIGTCSCLKYCTNHSH